MTTRVRDSRTGKIRARLAAVLDPEHTVVERIDDELERAALRRRVDRLESLGRRLVLGAGTPELNLGLVAVSIADLEELRRELGDKALP